MTKSQQGCPILSDIDTYHKADRNVCIDRAFPLSELGLAMMKMFDIDGLGAEK